MPIFLATTIFTATVGPGQVGFAYRLAHPDIKKHRSWFWQYLFFSLLIYTEAKNIIGRVAQLKQAMGETSWRVTPRSADPADGVPMIPSRDEILQARGPAQPQLAPLPVPQAAAIATSEQKPATIIYRPRHLKRSEPAAARLDIQSA